MEREGGRHPAIYCVLDVPVSGGDGCVEIVVLAVVDVEPGVVDVGSVGAVSWIDAFDWSGATGTLGIAGSLIGVPNGITVPVLMPTPPESIVVPLDWPGRRGMPGVVGPLIGVPSGMTGLVVVPEVAWLLLPDRDILRVPLEPPPPLTSWNAPITPRLLPSAVACGQA